jgi:hypothetical protein
MNTAIGRGDESKGDGGVCPSSFPPKFPAGGPVDAGPPPHQDFTGHDPGRSP